VLANAPPGELGRVWLEARQSEETLFEMRLRDGRHIELREARTKDGGTVGIYTDVTREREHERALARNEQRLRHIMASVFDGVITVDSSGAIESVNAAGERIFGWRAEGLVGEPIGRLLAPRGTASRERRQKALQFPDLKALQAYTLHELCGRRKDGTIFPVELSTAPIDTEQQATIICAVRDITQRKESEARILYHATHDHLTTLPNRNLMHDRLETAVRHAKRRRERLAVMFLDLDRFKLINDSLGHPAGDTVLVTVAERLRSALRAADTVARMGGDEFIVLLRDVHGAEDAVAVGEKLVRAVRQPFPLLGHELHLGLSIGISLFPEHGQAPDMLLQHADTALYEAKAAGRNRVRLFAPAMGDTSYQRMLLENRLRRALEREEFFLVYQPQYALGSRELRGFEALLRWRNAELGLVMPARFVPIAEESGMITELGLWVMRRALAESQTWSRLLPGRIRLGVNISPRQLHDPALARQIRELVEEAGAEPSQIELELTERVLMAESETVQTLIGELAAMGLSLVLDDFGTGYSSLSYLKRYPISRIKVDRSFVADMERSENDARLVRAMIGMAHGLGIGVTAEGIESPGQVSTLLGYGCDEGQGYLLGRPLEAAEALALVERSRPAREHGTLPAPRLVAGGRVG
jgi:diguanylate cyclase (GGDEF)-like protein/PAS domain S-box-containing protein